MSRMQIGNLNYSIKADTTQLNESATLTRQQMRDVRRVMEETKDPAQRLQEQIDRLTTIFQMGAITAEQYEAAVANVHARSPEGQEKERLRLEAEAEAKRKAAEAEAEYQSRLREGEAISRSVRTAEEARNDTIEDLTRHLREGTITQETFNRRMDQLDTDKIRRLKEEEERHNEALREAKRLTQEVETEEEQRARRLDHLNDLMRRGYLTQDAYNRQLDRIRQPNLMGGLRDAARDLSSSMPGVSQATSAFAAAGGGAAAGALAVGLGAVIAAGAGVIYTMHQISEQSREIDTITDSASKLGMTFSELGTLRLSLSQTSGLDEGAIDNALQRMTVGLHEANTKQAGGVFDSLQAMGLDAGELLKRGPVDALKEIMAHTQELQSPTDQLIVAYELFGKQGAALVSSLRDGPEELERMAQWAEQTGMNLSQAQAEGVGAANDAWEEMQMITTGMFRQMSAELAPVFQVIAEYVKSGSGEFSAMKDMLPGIIDMTAQFAGWLYDGYEVVDLTRKTLWNMTQLDFSQIGVDIANALDFGTGQRNLEAITKARQDAMTAAAEKQRNKENSDSVLAEHERKKEAEKRAIEEKKAKEREALQEQRAKEREAEQERKAAEREAEQEKKRVAQEADAERVKSFQEADKLLEKHKEGYALAKQMAQIDDLRMKGMLTGRDHAMMKQKLVEDEAAKDVKRAEAKTATRGSAEEYEIFRAMQSQTTDKQIIEMREQKTLMKINNENIARLVRAVEGGKKPMRIR